MICFLVCDIVCGLLRSERPDSRTVIALDSSDLDRAILHDDMGEDRRVAGLVKSRLIRDATLRIIACVGDKKLGSTPL